MVTCSSLRPLVERPTAPLVTSQNGPQQRQIRATTAPYQCVGDGGTLRSPPTPPDAHGAAIGAEKSSVVIGFFSCEISCLALGNSIFRFK